MEYIIVTDSTANLPEEIIEKYGIEIVSLSYFVNEVEDKAYEKGKKANLKELYVKMRNKVNMRTSLASPESFTDVFENIAKLGKNILYIGFTSGLSGTYQSGTIAAEIIKAKYPDIKLYTVDTLCAALGEGLLVYYAALMKQEGKTIEEVRDWLEENKLNMCHSVTVDDLFFLKRGGRVSATTAVAGTVLGIKPLLHVDIDGKLVTTGKIRGRKQSMNYLVEQFEKYAEDKENQIIAIGHGDCEEDAKYVISEIKKKYNIKEVVINYLDPVIGCHAGPGTLALFYIGSERKA